MGSSDAPTTLPGPTARVHGRSGRAQPRRTTTRGERRPGRPHRSAIGSERQSRAHDPIVAAAPRRALSRYTAAVKFLRDGMLAVGSQEGTVRIVDANTGLEQSRLHGPPETSEAGLATSPDSRTLFGIGYQGSESWDLSTGRLAWPRPGPRPMQRVGRGDRHQRRALSRADGRVQAIDLATGTVIASQFDYQAGTASGVTIGDNGNVLIETGGDPRVCGDSMAPVQSPTASSRGGSRPSGVRPARRSHRRPRKSGHPHGPTGCRPEHRRGPRLTAPRRVRNGDAGP